MATLMTVYATAMAYATFVENEFNATASKALIYNATWFEAIQVLLVINFIGNIVKYNLHKKSKFAILLFHISFIFILIGGAITRYISFEGVMPIRENNTSNLVISDRTYISLKIDNNEVQRLYEDEVLFSDVTNNSFETDFNFKEKNINVKYVDFVSKKQNNTMQDVLTVDVEIGDKKERLKLFGVKGMISPKNKFNLAGLNIGISYGSKALLLPFSIKLNDFDLERYPGSRSPASYSSNVTLIDEGKSTDYDIYMNNVLDYNGYRFFQSSYDTDEKGTILSVNHDKWGTGTTYFGYLLLTVGMILTLFSKKSRFMILNKKLNNLKKLSVIVLFALISQNSFAQHQHSMSNSFINVDSILESNIIPAKHADKFGKLVIQDNGGRLKPINTFSSELLRKIYRKDHYKNLNSDQVLLSITVNPVLWQSVPLIKIDNKTKLDETIGVEGKYASFKDFFNEKGEYKIGNLLETTYKKKPGARGTFDKELIKADEKINVLYMAISGSLLKLFPIPNDENNKWVSYKSDLTKLSAEDSLFVTKIIPWYVNTIAKAQKSNDWTEANQKIEFISKYQNQYGSAVMPSADKIKWEVVYNKQQPFKKLFPILMTVGLVMLLLAFVQLFSTKKWLTYLMYFFTAIVVLGFAYQTFGLGLRWYISGHAPWSNGYESMIYISWATLLAGFIFASKSKISLSATTILSAVILLVSHLNWLDPEITNLVPVLDSYWLMIHVAVITASYGFVGFGALLGFLVLLLYIFRNENNTKKLTLTIKELTYINEMTLTIGLFLLTIGTFLGGVWANESWGRYWGWDPKETWAWISVIVYAIVLHIRFIPALKGKYAFNLASVIAFASIIMTYFGVNFYLSGLHSYASGDPVPVPNFIYYTIEIVFVVAIIAYYRKRKTN